MSILEVITTRDNVHSNKHNRTVPRVGLLFRVDNSPVAILYAVSLRQPGEISGFLQNTKGWRDRDSRGSMRVFYCFWSLVGFWGFLFSKVFVNKHFILSTTNLTCMFSCIVIALYQPTPVSYLPPVPSMPRVLTSSLLKVKLSPVWKIPWLSHL